MCSAVSCQSYDAFLLVSSVSIPVFNAISKADIGIMVLRTRADVVLHTVEPVCLQVYYMSVILPGDCSAYSLSGNLISGRLFRAETGC